MAKMIPIHKIDPEQLISRSITDYDHEKPLDALGNPAKVYLSGRYDISDAIGVIPNYKKKVQGVVSCEVVGGAWDGGTVVIRQEAIRKAKENHPPE